MLAKKFIEKYGVDTRDYDVICGWRANASYFYIAKEFVRDKLIDEVTSIDTGKSKFTPQKSGVYEILGSTSVIGYSEKTFWYNESAVGQLHK